MSDDANWTGRSPPPTTDDGSRLAVVAHSLLGSVTAVRGAIELVMGDEPTVMTRDALLAMAARRLDVMGEQLRVLAAGLPQEALTFPDDLHDHSSTVDVREGTNIEVRSSFSDTWIAGFEIEEAVGGGYRVRRTSDGSVLSGVVTPDNLRAAPERGTPPRPSN